MSIYSKINDLGITLSGPIPKGGIYSSVRVFDETYCYTSGMGPNPCEQKTYAGKLGSTYTIDEGQQAARQCVVNMLSNLHATIGDLNRVESIVKLLVFVSSETDFYCQPEVANSASQLLVDIFGEDVGLASRSAVGVNVLPGNIPVEVEALIKLKPEQD